MRPFRLIGLLALSLQTYYAEVPATNFTLGPKGLTHLSGAGQEFLNNGIPGVDGVDFQGGSGGLAKAGTEATAIKVLNNTLKAEYAWGTLTYTYETLGTTFRIRIDLHNSSSQRIVGLRLTPLVLKLPNAPREYDGNTPLLVNSIGAPAITMLTTGGVRVFVVDEDVRKPLLLGFPWALDKPANLTFPLRLTIGRDGMYPDSLPTIDRPIPAGGNDHFEFSLRFAAADAQPEAIAKDVYRKFVAAFPSTIHWVDRRPIASLIIATSHAGWPTNPRGWFLDAATDTLDAKGVARFQARLLAWADDSITVMRAMHAQGMITWDLEGEEYPQPTTYIGDPRLLPELAPEMVTVADAYFQRFRDAGFRVGLTIRPQHLERSGSGYQQKTVADTARLLIEKINYAKTRWGASLFYIDSNGDSNAPIDASIFEAVARAVPDILLIPEQKTLRYAASTAPYYELRKGDAATPALTRACYPDAFSVINVADGDVTKYEPELRAAVSKGDLLLFRGWFNDPENAQIAKFYSAGARR